MWNIAKCSSIGIIITFYFVKIYVVLNDRPREFVFRSVSILIFYTQWLTPWFTTCANSFIQIHYQSYGTKLEHIRDSRAYINKSNAPYPDTQTKWNIMAHPCTKIRKLVSVIFMFCCWDVIRPSVFTINGTGHSGTGNCMDCPRYSSWTGHQSIFVRVWSQKFTVRYPVRNVNCCFSQKLKICFKHNNPREAA